MNMESVEDNKLNVLSMNHSETEPEVIHGYLLQGSLSSDDKYKTVMVHDDLTTDDSGGSSIHFTTVSLTDGNNTLVQQHTNSLQMADDVPSYSPVHHEIEKPNEDNCAQSQFFEGQEVKLEDGTTGYLYSTDKGGLQQVQLEDGRIAYISRTPLLDYDLQDVDDMSHVELHDKTKLNRPQGLGVGVHQQSRSSKAMALGDKAFRCLFLDCGRYYTSQHHLKVHERSHTGDRPFKCDIQGCSKAFATGYGLKSHTRTHTGEKPYKCTEDYCEKAFKTSGDLMKHVRTHTGEKPFKCPYDNCDRSFTTSNIRKVHVRTHTGERPYICPEEGCGRSFASATNYKNHVRIHTGEKPYVCTVHGCNKRFTEYSSLYKHHVVHTHTKPYNCNICGKNYRQTSTLAAHKRIAHGILESGDEDLVLQDCGAEGLEEESSQEEPSKKRSRVHLMVANPDDHGTANLAALQSAQQAAEQAIQQIHQQQAQLELSVASRGVGPGGHHVLLLADPAQFAALQQLTHQISLAQGLDGSGAVTLAHHADSLGTSSNGTLLTVSSEVFLGKRGDKLNIC